MATKAKTFEMLTELKAAKLFPTVVPGKFLCHVSPSQLSTFRDCPRKWYVETVLGVKQPETLSQRLGTEIHAVLEQMVHGEPLQGSLRAIEVATAGQSLLPPQGTPCQTEVEFVLRHASVRLPMYGFVDLITPQYAADHKSTKSIKLYAKSEYQWQTDPQYVIYSARERALGTRKDFRVNYFQTQGRCSDYVQVPVTDGALDFGLQVIGENVDQMIQYGTLEESQVPFGPGSSNTTASCPNYGGCHLKARCLSYGVVPEGMGAYQETAAALAAISTSTRSTTMATGLSPIERLRAAAAASKAKASEDAGPTEANGINPPSQPGDTDPYEAPAMAADAPEPEASAGEIPAQDPAPVAAPPPPPPRRSRPPTPKATEAAKAVTDIATPAAAAPTQVALAPDAPVTSPPELVIPVTLEALEQALKDAQDMQDTQKGLVAKLAAKVHAGKVAVANDPDDSDAADLLELNEQRLATGQKALFAREETRSAAAAAVDAFKKAAAEQAKKDAAAAAVKAAEGQRLVSPPAQQLQVVPHPEETGDSPKCTLYLGCRPSVATNLTYFDEWVQPFLQRAADARQVPFYRMIPHGAADAVVTEIVAALRSGKAAVPQHLVFREFAAQHYTYVQDLRPFFDEVVG